MSSSDIFTVIGDLPFTGKEKTELRIFFTDRDVTEVEKVLSMIEKNEEKVDYLWGYYVEFCSYKTDDKDANEFWKSLKDKNVERGEFLQLPKGIHFLGDEDENSIQMLPRFGKDRIYEKKTTCQR